MVADEKDKGQEFSEKREFTYFAPIRVTESIVTILPRNISRQSLLPSLLEQNAVPEAYEGRGCTPYAKTPCSPSACRREGRLHSDLLCIVAFQGGFMSLLISWPL
jgi:hypothetical protein